MDELVISPPKDPSVPVTPVRRVPSLAVITRFVLTGGSVAVLHLGLVSAMVLLGVDIQVALILAYLVSLTVHFTLNRQWVFASNDGYAFGFTLQGLRYLCLAAFSYAVTATAVAFLPEALGIPELAVFFLVTAVMACVTFLVLQLWVFREAPNRAA